MAHNQLRFCTICGNIDRGIDAGFDLAREITALRSAGYLLHESFYIPMSSILAVFTFDKDAQPGAPENINLSSDKGRLN
jgi:hypothetical protein